MKLRVKKEPWSHFLTKAATVLLIIFIAGYYFASRYKIGIDSQVVKCIPGYSVYLIDKRDTELKRGKTFVFSAKGLQPFYEDGTEMVKYLRGEPGDHVKIDDYGNIYVNKQMMGYGLTHAEALGQSMDSFVGELTLPDNGYWFMGTSNQSFDSRYWGTVQSEQIIGRAYPLF